MGLRLPRHFVVESAKAEFPKAVSLLRWIFYVRGGQNPTGTEGKGRRDGHGQAALGGGLMGGEEGRREAVGAWGIVEWRQDAQIWGYRLGA